MGNLSEKSKEKWTVLQEKYKLENAQTDAMVSLIVTDNWVEYTLRYVVNYNKRRVTKTALFTSILAKIEATNGEVKFASATFQLVDPPEFKVNIKQDKM
ncbi:MAG: hypothetical protein NWQ31_01905 [Polaribacter sp.]|nr:hypothetical protein [Polaribacter sp.]